MFMLLPLSAVAITLAIVLTMRSTKDFPKNFAQFRSEMIYQWLGLVGVADDIISKKRNRIGELILWRLNINAKIDQISDYSKSE